MSIFGRATFSSASYAAFRPSYPPVLFNRLLAFHHYGRIQDSPMIEPPSGTLLDLGCGHGVVARSLAPHFSSVIGLDPSAGMVQQARRLVASEGGSISTRITFRQGGAEDLSFLADGSVDCAVAGQAAHWFDYKRAWPELARVVRSGGTLAFWGYKDHVIIGYPATTAIYERFTYGETEPVPGWESMARFWEMPGRGVLRDSYSAIVPPEADWHSITRIAWDPDPTRADPVADAPKGALLLRRRLTLDQLQGYLRTYSAFHGWKEAHPDKKSRAEGGDGDIIDLMFDEMIAAVPEWRAKGDDWRQVEVEIVWSTVLLLAKRQ
ncbi:hypothetical protein VTH82DRAFT_1665 [Thermothelomyces myriococcoides]